MLSTLLVTLAFVGIGIAAFGLVFFLIINFSPFSIRKEIEQDQNVALAILVGSVFLGIAIIIAAAVKG